MRSTVRDILRFKGDAMLQVAVTASAAEAADRMYRHQVGSLVVCDGPRILGLLTERDLLHGLIRIGQEPKKVPVRALYEANRVSVGLDAETRDCMELMTRHRQRYLFVEEGDAVVGLVSIGDVVNRLLQDGAHEVQALTSYISGVYTFDEEEQRLRSV